MPMDHPPGNPLLDGFPPASPAPRKRRPVAPVLAVILIIAAAGLSIWYYGLRAPVEPFTGPDYCGSASSGLVRTDGECIGVTDGSYLLMPELQDEQQRLVQQNQDIGSERSVTVAVFNPLTPDDTSALAIGEIQHQLQGALVAQKWMNDDAAGTSSVRIRLVLANQGGHQTHWKPVVEQLNRMKDDPSPLVAAIGMGVSVQPTLDAAKLLSEYGIPSIGAVTTADDLNQTEASAFFRVSPSNRDYVEALKPWTKGFSSALMVYDVASDDVQHPDIFTRSLRDDFTAEFAQRLTLTKVNYHGEENSKDVQANRFGLIRNKICTEKVPLVLFAGRRNDLGKFVKALQGRDCAADVPVTVMVGGTDLGGLVTDATLSKARITLVWSAGADVVAWEKGQGAPRHFKRFLDAYRTVYGQEDLADGEAVAGYDAVLAAARGAQSVDDNPADDESAADKTRPLPSGIDVRGELLNTHSLGAIAGASGDLSYEQRDDGLSGNPIGKVIPVLQQGIPVPSAPTDVYVTR